MLPFWEAAQIGHFDSGTTEEYAAQIAYYTSTPIPLMAGGRHSLGWFAALMVVCRYAAGSENIQPLTFANVELVRQVRFDVVGHNPFRPVVADPAWLTPTAVSIADAIYQDRGFDRLPILADALEEAGCTNADLLLHCREPGEHVRGCWAVDLVLGKT